MTNPKRRLNLVVFSGFHDSELDARFLAALVQAWESQSCDQAVHLNVSMVAIDDPVWWSASLCHNQAQEDRDLLYPRVITVFLGFSAGCIRAAYAAHMVFLSKEPVAGLIAVDGWGLPLMNAQIPSYRLSHDCFTHCSSKILGGQGLFFADPPVSHLSLWGEPDRVQGWFGPDSDSPMEMSAIAAIVLILQTLSGHFPRR